MYISIYNLRIKSSCETTTSTHDYVLLMTNDYDDSLLIYTRNHDHCC